jgi:hypothetical protein
VRRPPNRNLRAPALGLLLVGVDIVVGLAVGGPYPGATALLVLACGVSTAPFLPSELDRIVLRVAVLPAVGIVSFAVILTTISIAGVRLTEASVRLAIIAFVGGCAALARVLAVRAAGPRRAVSRIDVLAGAAMILVLGLALASAWDIVGPFPPDAVDWGHYLLYADEVEVERALLIDDRYAGEDGRLFADSPGVGALYGAVRILDGTSSERLTLGIVVIAGLTVLSVFVAAGALWRLWAGVLTAAVWAVAPSHVEPIRWHAVGNHLAFVFLPLVVLALALLYRGSRGPRVVFFLGISVLGVAVMHSTSAVVAGAVIAMAVFIDLVRQAAKHGPDVAAWWREGITRPVLGALGVAAIAGAGVLVHLRAQASDLGSPVSFRQLQPDWLSWEVVVDHYSTAFLLLSAASAVTVLAIRELRRDPAMLAVLALATACVVLSELWRLEVSFEYRRSLLYAGLAMTMLVGAASSRLGRGPVSVLGAVVVLAYAGHITVGLRLPERLLSGSEPKGTAALTIRSFGESLARGDVEDAAAVVTDSCHTFVVPYLLRRPTLVAFAPWQVGFKSRVPLAARATAILHGGPEGRRLARSLGVGYVVANPSCTPDLPKRLGGSVVVETSNVIIVDLN